MTYREQFLRKYDLSKTEHFSIEELSEITKIPVKALQEVYNRGIGAWKTNIESVRLKKDFSKNPDTTKYPRSARLSKEQWGMSRVFSFIVKGKTFQTTDRDIAVRYGLI